MTKAIAAMLYAPETIRIEEITLPGCGPEDVLVRLEKATLCPTDIKKYRALKPDVEAPLREIGPYVLGHEAAGIVAEVGDKVTTVKVGDAVAIQPMIACGSCAYCREGKPHMCQNLLGIGGSAGNFGDCDRLFHEEGVGGCFATHLKAPQACVIRLPDGMSMAAGSMMEPLADVIHSVENAGVGPGDAVVIIGLGPMGLFHVVAAKYYGAGTIICVDIDDERLKIAKNLGANAAVNSVKTDPVARVREMTEGLGAGKIFVTAGGRAQAACAGQAMEMVRKEGTVALFASADVTADKLAVSLNKIHYDMLHLTGTVGFSKEHGEKALALLASGIFDPELIRNCELPLERIEEAIGLYGKGANLKIGLDLKGQ
jgi:L-iditol 2-dehydrogenase